MDDSEWNPNISGFSDGVDAKAERFATILLSVMIDEQMVFLLVEDVFYVEWDTAKGNIYNSAEDQPALDGDILDATELSKNSKGVS
ncbi:unnamed protein product [Albugo candida]|uniref:Uncharacterized protein n=1 Tax=Albugo candida TaxID=65357 RepID=A0A024FUX2_9STRA|nr:unnamed protein product [Albugo candida]|eukprot:CCI10841.1 unnamed protein product [Albugo candida]